MYIYYVPRERMTKKVLLLVYSRQILNILTFHMHITHSIYKTVTRVRHFSHSAAVNLAFKICVIQSMSIIIHSLIYSTCIVQ